mmetsp:Transcript_4005/g.6083  ORF Transcript_4005/g.6083 Transcript_4005/m.6083 type:complete len:241 (-) Transcript_4005:551-1273(-)
MVGNKLILLGGKGGGSSLLLKTNHDTVNGSINLLPSDGRLSETSGGNSGLVHKILKLSSTESRGTTGDGLKINIRLKGLSTGVDSKDTGTSLEIREVDSDLSVETSRTEKSLVKYIDTICGGNGDNSGVSIETVHLYKELVNSLLTFIVSSGESSTTLTSNGVDLINKDDTRGVLLSLRKDITDTGSSNSDEHLNKFGSRNGDEGNSGLSGNSLSEEGLTSSGGSVKDDSTGDTASISIV